MFIFYIASAPSIPAAAGASSQNGDSNARLLRSPQSKIESLKNWSISSYKCTKQLLFEKLGKTSRTVDTGSLSSFQSTATGSCVLNYVFLSQVVTFSELESRIEHLRDIKRRYLQVLGLSRALTSHFYHVIQTQVTVL